MWNRFYNGTTGLEKPFLKLIGMTGLTFVYDLLNSDGHS